MAGPICRDMGVDTGIMRYYGDAHFTIDMLVCLLFMVASKRCQLSHNKIHSIKVLLDFMGGFTPQC